MEARIRVHCDIHVDWRFGRSVLEGIIEEVRERRLPWGLTSRMWRTEDVWTIQPQSTAALVIGTARSSRTLDEWVGRGMPFVCVSGGLEPRPGVAVVSTDDVAIGVRAAEHFLSRGFTQFGVLTDPQIQATRMRADAFRRRVSAYSVAVHEGWDPKGLWGFLDRLPAPVGIFCPTDQIARCVATLADQMSRKVPEEFAILGVDDDPLQSNLSPVPLSSIDPRPREIGRLAAATAAEILAGRTPPDRQLVSPGELRVRQSSDLVAVADPIVADVLRIIRARATEGVRAGEVLAPRHGSRRNVETKFRRLLGRSIEDEIRRQRLEAAREMLLATELPVERVGELCGFPDAPHFTRRFRRTFGVPPGAYRRRGGSPP